MRRFFLPNTRSGTILVALTLKQGDVETPLDLIPLTEFQFNEQNGLSFPVDTQTQLSNYVGYRFRVTSDTTVRARFFISFAREISPQITARAEQVRQVAEGIGYLPAAALAQPLRPIADLERAIVSQFGYDGRSQRDTVLGFGSSNYSAVRHRFRLLPETQMNGVVTIDLRRDLSAFDMPIVRPRVSDGQVSFGITGYGVNYVSPVRSGIIAGQPLLTRVGQLMGSNLGLLSSPAPAQFQVACATLLAALESPTLNLTTQDKILAFWALTAPNENMRSRDVRRTSCVADQESQGVFSSFGLAMPPIVVALPAEYEAVMQRARQQAQQAQDEASQARTVAASAQNHAQAATLPTRPNGVGRIVVPDFLTYEGQTALQPPCHSPPCGPFLGRIVYDEDQRRSDTIVGEFVSARDVFHETPWHASALVTNGRGIYTFGENAGAGGQRQYVGQFTNGAFSGSGHLTWRDGRTYAGQFSGGAPNGLGVMAFPDGRQQFGEFLNGALSGRGVERPADGGSDRYGIWSRGNLSTLPAR